MLNQQVIELTTKPAGMDTYKPTPCIFSSKNHSFFLNVSNGKMTNAYDRNAYKTDFYIGCMPLRPLGEDLPSQESKGSVVKKQQIKSQTS